MDVLLKTKLYTPPVSAWFVPRPRLTGRLEEGLACKLILISAPAGFGKTALLGEWIGKCGYPYAWLSLDEGDNDPIRFLSYVIAALQSIDPDLVRGLTVQMGGPDLPSMQAMLPVLINNLASKTEPILLVLDDYQAIHNPVIH